MTVSQWIERASKRLSGAGIPSPKLEAQVLAAHVLRVERSWLLAHPEGEFPELVGEPLILRRENREPLAYILGYREFFGRRFQVTPTVLIPRQETEILVEVALRSQASQVPQKCGFKVLDLGTGSGSIAITLKLERPDWDVTASDISAAALAVAEKNGEAFGADVRFVESDGFRELLGESFDLIVTNPPYIGEDEPLDPEVKGHEPQVALFAGRTGNEFYQRLAVEAQDYLKTGGHLIAEVGYRQAEAVTRHFQDSGWRWIETVKDLSGVDRVLVFQPVFECQVRKG